MSFSSSIQWYHPHADPIWPDGTFNPILLLDTWSRREMPTAW